MAIRTAPGFWKDGWGFSSAPKAVPAAGPPTTGLVRHWSAATPLLSVEGDSEVYVQSGTAYTAGTVHGIDGIKFTAAAGYLTGPGIAALTNVNFVTYALVSRFASVSAGRQLGGVYGDADGDVWVSNAFSGTDVTGECPDGDTPAVTLTADTAYVVSVERSTGLTIRMGINGTYGATLDAFDISPWNYSHEIGAISAIGYSSAVGVWIMESLVYTGSHDSDVVDYLLGLVS